MEYQSISEKDTFDFAKKFAKKIKGGEVIGLVGDLGAGKTVFAKGLASGLGVKQKITSPTFVLMKVYPVKKAGIKKFIHIDAYRLKSARDLKAIGAGEYLNDSTSVSLIEWADKVKGALPKKTVYLKFNLLNSNKRLISKKNV